MRILVACEYSGVVRDAFLRSGHYALSCDLLPSESDFGEHYQGDVFDVINDDWDMMIAHPPCTYLSNAGIAWFNEEKYGEKALLRKEKRLEAMNFVNRLWAVNIEKICIENPVGYLNSHWQKPSQTIQPWQFGVEESKITCFWLKGLQPLKPTKIVKPTIYRYVKKAGANFNRPVYFVQDNTKIKGAKMRSKFFVGIAEAMVEQWG